MNEPTWQEDDEVIVPLSLAPTSALAAIISGQVEYNQERFEGDRGISEAIAARYLRERLGC